MPVQKQTRAGQRTRFKAFVAIGDFAGHVGLGVKCAKEVATAIRGAIILAKLSVVPVRRGYWGAKLGEPHTVPCKVDGKVGSVYVALVPAPRGTGIVAAPASKRMLQLAGIEDCYTQSRGNTSTMGNLCVLAAPRPCAGQLELTFISRPTASRLPTLPSPPPTPSSPPTSGKRLLPPRVPTRSSRPTSVRPCPCLALPRLLVLITTTFYRAFQQEGLLIVELVGLPVEFRLTCCAVLIGVWFGEVFVRGESDSVVGPT